MEHMDTIINSCAPSRKKKNKARTECSPPPPPQLENPTPATDCPKTVFWEHRVNITSNHSENMFLQLLMCLITISLLYTPMQNSSAPRFHDDMTVRDATTNLYTWDR